MPSIHAEPGDKDYKRRKCPNCKVTVQYLPIDVQEYNGTDYSGGPDGQRWVDCPRCNKKIILESW